MTNSNPIARLVGLEARVRKLEVQPRLASASLEDAAIPSFDRDGNIKAVIGRQRDGAHTVVVVDGPTPLQPTDAICKGGQHNVEVTWDGNLISAFGEVDAELEAYSDFEACEIHIGATEGFAPSPETLRTELGRQGGTVLVPALAGQVWVRLVIRSQAKKHGPPSPAVPVAVSELVDPAMFDQLETDLADLAIALTDAETVLDQLEGTDLPALDAALTDAKARLDASFGIGASLDVNAALQNVATEAEQAAASAASAAEQAAKDFASGAISQAELDILAAAAVDAEAKADQARLDAVSTASSDAASKAAAAQQAAIDAAKSYADGEIDAATLATLQQAATDAQNKADAAKAAAIGEAQAQAEDLADAARTAAITAAATDAQQKADAAAAAAEQAAKAYADGEIDASALAVAQQAATDAQSKADAARDAAIAAAATDATSKANAAELAAKQAAAIDAQNKANAAAAAAETAAKNHADLVAQGAEQAAIDAAALDAQAKANAAETAAINASKAYADTLSNGLSGRLDAAESSLTTLQGTTLPALTGRVTEAETDLSAAFPSGPFNVSTQISSAASTAKSEAISAAASDATTKANNAKSGAEATAKGYTDTQITAVTTSINGKNSTTYTDIADGAAVPTTPPSVAGRRPGDIHRVRRSSGTMQGVIEREWMLNTSNNWIVVNFGDNIMRSLDVGKLVAGTATLQTAVVQKFSAEIATVIQLNASRITAGTINTARLNTTEIAASVATVISLDAARITSGTIDTARLSATEISSAVATIISLDASRITSGLIKSTRIDVADLAASVATVIQLNADRITAGTIATARLNTTEIAASVATVISLNAARITSGTISTARLDAQSVAAHVGSFLSITANQIATGTLSAVVTLSGTFRTATTGARTELTSAGLKIYNASNGTIMDATGGAISIIGSLRTGTATTGVHIEPDTSFLGDGVVRWRGGGEAVAANAANIALEAGTGNWRRLRIEGVASNATLNPRPALDFETELVSGKTTIVAQASTLSGLLENIDLQTDSGLHSGLINIESGAPSGSAAAPNITIRGRFIKFTGSSASGTESALITLDTTDVEILKTGAGATLWFGTKGSTSYTPFITSPKNSGNLDIGAPGDAYLKAGVPTPATTATSYLRIIASSGQLVAPGVGGNTTSNSANVYSTPGGYISRLVSLRAYKVAIEDARVPDNILDLRPRTWFDRGDAERYADWLERGADPDDPDLAGITPLNRVLGLVAEEVEELGMPELLTRDEHGAVAGVAYDRVAVALIPEMRSMRERIERLEALLLERV